MTEDDMTELEFETAYRLIIDFRDKRLLEMCIAMLQGLRILWYRVYKIERAE